MVKTTPFFETRDHIMSSSKCSILCFYSKAVIYSKHFLPMKNPCTETLHYGDLSFFTRRVLSLETLQVQQSYLRIEERKLVSRSVGQ